MKHLILKPVWLSVIFFTITWGVLLPGGATAKENATISDIKLANTRDDLLVYFDVNDAFTPKINQAALNGAPTTFSFRVSLYQTQGYLFDKKIADVQIKSTLKYNSLKKNFSISRPWKDKTSVIVHSYADAKTLMTQIDNLTVIPLVKLVKGEKYQLRIKAKLDKVTLPLSLHTILFFVSLWDFETNWYVINFTY